MRLKAISTLAALLTLVLTAGACGSDDKSGSSTSALEKKCATMCEHLMAPPLSGCGKSDAADPVMCKNECYSHMVPKSSDQPPEATEPELDCATRATTCDAWSACGDFL